MVSALAPFFYHVPRLPPAPRAICVEQGAVGSFASFNRLHGGWLALRTQALCSRLGARGFGLNWHSDPIVT